MIEMIIADDEPVIAKGLQKLVNWEQMGIRIVAIYDNGREALNGIIKIRPKIALLDIQMPGLTGVDILKELNKLELDVDVIFISGFQDFEYAKAALQYGAKDYLLKPIVKEELFGALEKVIPQSEKSFPETAKEEKAPDYSKLVQIEDTFYIPVYIEIFLDRETQQQAARLLKFSIRSFLERYLEAEEKGILFFKDINTMMIFKGLTKEEVFETLAELRKEISRRFGCESAYVCGEVISSMSQIPIQYEKCIGKKGYLFFADQLANRIIQCEKEVFSRKVKNEEVKECRIRISETILLQKTEQFQKELKYFIRLISVTADGKKEDACFHYCLLIKEVEGRILDAGIPCDAFELKELLEKGRTCENYQDMQKVYQDYLKNYQDAVNNAVSGNENSNFLKAKAYIEVNYSENLNLEVLAGVVHMNPYYFSSFFKKNAGENFKDYLKKVRLKHALPLVISTRMTGSEIAEQTGFSDVRSFNEAFLKVYGENPMVYRKRAGKE